jgi:hypothetical protein
MPAGRLPLVAASLGLALASAGVLAQEEQESAPAPAAALREVDPLDITGRTFSGLRLPLTATDGRISLRGQRAYVWNEQDRPSGAVVQRVLLEGDVELRLGIHAFSATRAALWLQRLDEPNVWQVFVYIDHAGVPMQAPGGITIAGDRLPVQGVIRAADGVELGADRLLQGRPQTEFLLQGESALAARLRRLVVPEPPTGASPEELIRRGEPVPPIAPLEETREDALARQRRDIARLERTLEPTEFDQPIFSRRGVISIAAGDIKMVPEDGKRALLVSGGLTVSYIDRPERGPAGSSMQISAQRGVVFLNPEADASATRWSAGDISGLYLEGDVQALIETSRGRYTIRSPRVYYDIQNDRGLLVDAVFNTTDAPRNLPLWVRAKSISQLSANTFRATEARITNTPFLEPDLSIGASSVTITQQPTLEQEQRVIVDARNITLRAGDIPFFWWPQLKGDPSEFPLRDLRLENSSGSGGALKTTWNGYTLLGIDPPQGTSLDLIADYYFDRGPALGADFSWRGIDYTGNFFGYMVPHDTGRDLLITGVRERQDGEFRGMVMGEHRMQPAPGWTIFAEGSYISDPTFIDGFFEPLARQRREFTNSLYAQRIIDNTVLFGEVQANANDFIANQYLMQSPGYTVTRLPDLGYVRLADDLLDMYPGLLSYSSEYRFTQMRLEFPKPPVHELGFRTLGRSQAFFGIRPDQSVADALRDQGLREEWVSRFDTRHELTMPLSVGPVNVVPFAVGRFTGYADDFQEFSPDADEPYRLWGAAGVTLSTELQHVDNSVESRLLDLHRIRHIVTPSFSIWHGATTIDRTDLPVYDAGVESIAEGTAMRFGLSQVWQTQRGGPGRWRSVDVFRLDTELVVSSGDVDDETPINRYFTYRPEYSALGPTFLTVDAAWQVTEVLGIGLHEIFDFETNQSDRTSVGFVLQHAPEFSTFAEIRYINPQNQTFALAGLTYELTRKYALQSTVNYDMDQNEVQSINTTIRRRYPSVILGIGIGYNNITNETSLGFIVQPFGIGGSAALRGVGSDTGNFGIGG